ncbi:MAG: cell division protein FtsZ, partial [bacterium]|nr:cell division protein FtsZ [bacterium]
MLKTRKHKKAAKRRSAKKTRKPAQKKSDTSFDMPRTRVRVVGIGGGGSNIIEEIASRVPRVDFFAANTDMQDLKKVQGKVRAFPFGQKLTRGLGCGMDADLGEQAARSEKERIKKLFEGQDVSILIASLGGGTGSGAVTVFAEAAREAKSLVLGIFTLPFEFEGKKRKDIAQASLEKLRPLVNAYTVIPNERIFKTIEKTVPFPQALSMLNRNLADSLGGLIDALYSPGLINIDFADVRSVLEGRGRLAYAAATVSSGPDRAKGALNALFANSLHEYGVAGADRILFHLTADKNLKMQEVADVSRGIFSLNPKARIILGITLRPELRDKLRVMLFAVGCVEGKQPM